MSTGSWPWESEDMIDICVQINRHGELSDADFGAWGSELRWEGCWYGSLNGEALTAEPRLFQDEP